LFQDLRLTNDESGAAGPKGRAALQLTDMQSETSPAGGLRLPSGKHTGILTYFQTAVKKENEKKFMVEVGEKAESLCFLLTAD